ncbi:MAG: DUF5106 domain-containing protein [Chitinophagaceae bacterium]|nr:MAG: DUF5106 domain-containing protein [Chitinophagaceae bacterium]
MKKNFLHWFFLIAFLAVSLPAFSTGIKIQFTVDGFKDTTALIAYHFTDKQYVSDTVKIDSRGRFVFERDTMLQGGIYMAVMPDQRYFEFLINGTETNFSLETSKSDYIKNMKVRGSKENQAFYEYLKYITPKGREVEQRRRRMANADSEEKIDEIRAEIQSIEKSVRDYRRDVAKKHNGTFLSNLLNAMEEPEIPEVPEGEDPQMFRYQYYKTHFFDKVDFSDSRLLRTPIFHSKIVQYIERLTPQHPDSLIQTADYLVEKARANKDIFRHVVVHITSTFERHKIMGMDAVFVHMVENYYSGDQAFWMDEARLLRIRDRASTLKPLLIGKKAQNIRLQDTNGNWHSLLDVDADYTVLYFWDPDCGHCRRSTPKLKTMYDELNEDGVEIFAVTTERELEKWKNYVDEHNLNWINVADPDFRSNFRNHYDINATPVVFLLDENKKIIAKNLGVEQLHEYLKRLIADKQQ